MEEKSLLRKVYEQGVALGACGGFTEATSIRDIIEMLFSPQGVEFCIKRGFPSIEMFRQLGAVEDTKPMGVYIDCGEITLEDPKRVFLVGNTFARVLCKATQGNVLYLMHGAEATVTADGYSVTRIEKDKNSSCTIDVGENAVIL